MSRAFAIAFLVGACAGLLAIDCTPTEQATIAKDAVSSDKAIMVKVDAYCDARDATAKALDLDAGAPVKADASAAQK